VKKSNQEDGKDKALKDEAKLLFYELQLELGQKFVDLFEDFEEFENCAGEESNTMEFWYRILNDNNFDQAAIAKFFRARANLLKLSNRSDSTHVVSTPSSFIGNNKRLIL